MSCNFMSCCHIALVDYEPVSQLCSPVMYHQNESVDGFQDVEKMFSNWWVT
jgi:hypothetical protein